MTLNVAFAVFCGGAVGALIRYGCGQLESRVFADSAYPKDGRGTLCANLLACYLLGIFYPGSADPAVWDAIWIAGVCGGLSTFSSLALEIHDWLEQRRFARAVWVTVLTCLGGLTTMALGSLVS